MRKTKKMLWYHPGLVPNARDLRNNPTKAEELLWHKLKRKQRRGVDFHRQKPIHYYIVDFYCPSLFLEIEIDGGVHSDPDVQNSDLLRQAELEELGVVFLRFTNKEVFSNMDQVVQEIDRCIEMIRGDKI
jgi:very-short-patch-repair endonuclease